MKKIIFSILAVASVVSVSAEGDHKGGHGMAHWMAPAADTAIPNPVKYDAASIDRGKSTYFQNCASCHGAKAMGDGPAAAALNPKPANLAMMSGMHPDGDFAWKISNGRGAMPAWKGILSKTQIWELVNYIKSLKGTGKMMGNMDMEAMKKMMPGMDHSKMNMEEMKKMMPGMNMGGGSMGHSDSDGHHSEKKKVDSHNDEAKEHAH